MPLFEEAMEHMKLDIINELEQRLLNRLEPQIIQKLYARHMSISEAAEYLHVSVQTIRRMVRDKVLPSFHVRNQIFIRQLDVDDWILSQIGSTESRNNK